MAHHQHQFSFQHLKGIENRFKCLSALLWISFSMHYSIIHTYEKGGIYIYIYIYIKRMRLNIS